MPTETAEGSPPKRRGPKLYLGRYVNKVDKKGRVSIPAAYRSLMQEDGSGNCFICYHEDLGFLEVISENYMYMIYEKISAFTVGSKERTSLEAKYYTNVQEIKLDSEGRIILPKDYAAWTSIDAEVLFAGMGDRFEMWCPERYEGPRAQRLAMAAEIDARSSGGGVP